ncbi:MAG: flagellar hook-length control protein FliK [Mariprofundaceae bacterium]
MIESTQTSNISSSITKSGKAGRKGKNAMFAKLLAMFQKQLKAMQAGGEKTEGLNSGIAPINKAKEAPGSTKTQGLGSDLKAMRLHINDMLAALKSMHAEGQNLDLNAEDLLVSIQEMGIPLQDGFINMEALFAANIPEVSTSEKPQFVQSEHVKFTSTEELIANTIPTSKNTSTNTKHENVLTTTKAEKNLEVGQQRVSPVDQQANMTKNITNEGKVSIRNAEVGNPLETNPNGSQAKKGEQLTSGKEYIPLLSAKNKNVETKQAQANKGDNRQGMPISLRSEEGATQHIRRLDAAVEQGRAHASQTTKAEASSQQVNKDTPSLTVPIVAQNQEKRQVRTEKSDAKTSQATEVSTNPMSTSTKKDMKSNPVLQASGSEAVKVNSAIDGVRTAIQSEVPGFEQDTLEQKIVDLQRPETRSQRGEFQTHLNTLKTTRPMPMIDAMYEVSKAAKDGVARLEIQLEPAHLGKINITIQTDAAKQIQVNFMVDQGVSRQLIEQNLPLLRSAMAQQGLDLGGFSMQQGQSDDSSSFDQRQQQDGRGSNQKTLDHSLSTASQNKASTYSGDGRLSIRA